ncbi:CRISPR-associated endonuclease Cas2 [Macrococcus equipercicus]|uniref:CRISPR-associated endoribonuclease Cas2 n=1 Tax=Macrococcus equipercicus TaxID=69967 RepID=A0A9Q9BX15_9STAP|nr:CRISPR-associated endonuclease Cas2 [Macrococcus equipercicus]UTH14648.1 CRISPR-associated endonuclease Cas2 [Macrococcus equipercicus]
MLVLVTYDVNTMEKNGRKRLRHVAKKCLDYGQRVQNSVFECSLEPEQYVKLKADLEKIIDSDLDSLRFYMLGKNWVKRVETLGKDESYNPDTDVFIL